MLTTVPSDQNAKSHCKWSDCSHSVHLKFTGFFPLQKADQDPLHAQKQGSRAAESLQCIAHSLQKSSTRLNFTVRRKSWANLGRLYISISTPLLRLRSASSTCRLSKVYEHLIDLLTVHVFIGISQFTEEILLIFSGGSNQ